MGMPYQVMLAAMADGWVVRNDCVWSKGSPMPESVKGTRWQRKRCTCREPHHDAPIEDRPGMGGNRRNGPNVSARTWANAGKPDCPHCDGTGVLEETILRRGSWRHTRSHEMVLMLTKGMHYFSDSEAVREEATMKPQRRTNGHSVCTYDPPGRQAPPRGDRGVKDEPGIDGPGGRNPRSVLTPASSQCDLEHYASFPPALCEPLIKASVPAQCCAVCGAGYAPVIREGPLKPRPDNPNPVLPYDAHSGHTNGTGATSRHMERAVTVHGYRPTCTCVTDLPPRPGICLDPFAGTGTTLVVARALRRQAIGCDLSHTYLQRDAWQRLGFTALDAWEGRPAPRAAEDFTALPLFGGSHG